MRDKIWYAAVIALFILFLAIRLSLSLSVPYFSSDESYDAMRLAEQFRADPFFTHDAQSYLGGEVFYHPIQAIVFSLLYYEHDPFMGYKVVLNIFLALSTLILSLFLISISENKIFGVGMSVVLMSIPLLFGDILNTVTIYPLALICIVLSCVSFLKRKELSWKITLYIFTLLGILLTPAFLCIIFAFILYVGWKKILKKEIEKTESDFILFSSTISVVWNYVLYHPILETSGFSSIIAQNSQTVYDLILFLPILGLIPFVLSLFSILRTFSDFDEMTIFFASLNFTALLFLLFTIGPPLLWLILINIASLALLVPLSDSWYKYLQRTKISSYAYSIIIASLFLLSIIHLLFTFTFAYATLTDSTDQQFVDMLTHVKSVDSHPILVPIAHAHATMYFTGMPTFADSKNTYIQNAKYRQDVLKSFYETPYASQTVEAQTKLGVRKENPAYVIDLKKSQVFSRSSCYVLLYDSQSGRIYKTECESFTQ